MKLLPYPHRYLKPVDQLPVKFKRFLIPHLNPRFYAFEDGILLTHGITFPPLFKIKTNFLRIKKDKILEPSTSTKKVILLYMKEGSLDVTHSSLGEFKIKENYYYLFCVPTGEKSTAHLKVGNYQILKLHIDLNWILEFDFDEQQKEDLKRYDNDPDLGYCLFEYPISPFLKSIIEKLEQQVINNSISAKLFIIAQNVKLLELFIEDYEDAGKRKKHIDHDLFLEILNFMDANTHLPNLLQSVTKHVGLSETQLRRRFQKYLIISPAKHVLNIRMIQAEKMITKSDLDFKKISESLGYKYYKTFINNFKKFYKTTPLEMRKQI